MADKLLPCPFCGGEARLAHDFIHGWEVMCDNWKECIAHPSVVIYGDDSRDKAIEAWNNRPSPWHTGTPTEEGLYIVYNKHLCYDIVEVKPWTVLHDIVAYMPFNAYVKLGEKNNG